MPFIPGKSGNPEGKRKGTLNKKTASMRENVQSFLDKNWSKVQRDFNKIKDPKDRLDFVQRLLPYIVPRMQSVDARVSVDEKIQSLTEDQLEAIVDHILKKDLENIQ